MGRYGPDERVCIVFLGGSVPSCIFLIRLNHGGSAFREEIIMYDIDYRTIAFFLQFSSRIVIFNLQSLRDVTPFCSATSA